MDDKQLRDLMDYLSASSFSEFELEREGFKLRLVKNPPPGAVQVVAAPGGTPATVGNLAAARGATPSPPAPPVGAGEPPPGPTDDLEDIASPMVGTFYRASNPNADPFVEVGDTVQPGQVIGIVEAMKLMNEIEADRSGEIVEIPVANGQPVEYGETIFRIRPVPS